MGWALGRRNARLYFPTQLVQRARYIHSWVTECWVVGPIGLSAHAKLRMSLFFKDQSKCKASFEQGAVFYFTFPCRCSTWSSARLWSAWSTDYGSTTLAGHVLCFSSPRLEHSPLSFRQVLRCCHSPSASPICFLLSGYGGLIAQFPPLHSFKENKRLT